MRRNLLGSGILGLAVILLAGIVLFSQGVRAQFPAPEAHANPPPPGTAQRPGNGRSTAPSSAQAATALVRPQRPADCLIIGSITLTDAGHTSQVFGLVDPSTCANATCPGPFSPGGIYNYDIYTFTNNLNTAQCIDITITDFGCGGGLISAAYQTSFDPANVCTNYLGDSSSLGILGTGAYSVTVAANSIFIIDIESYTTSTTCANYTLAVAGDVSGPGCSTGGTPTPTPTIDVGTPTPTAVSATPTHTATALLNTPTPTRTATAGGSTATRTATAEATHTPTVGVDPTPSSVSATASATVIVTVTPCPIQFTDVMLSDPFYPYIRCLACRNILSGYSTSPPCAASSTPCFNGGAAVTRGQVAKIISNAAGYSDPIPSTRQTFTDVPFTNPFWIYIERLAEPGRQYISGYSTTPPCTTGTPCFLPFNNVTRGQMAKIDANAGGFFDAIPSTQQTFTDVPNSNPFWVYIERAALHGVISGYSTSPPCPAGVPCFLWANNLTRNQAAKVVAVTFFPNCQTPARSGSSDHPAP